MVLGIEADHANKEPRTGVEAVCWQIIEHLKKVVPSEVRVILYSRFPLKGELGILPLNWESKILPWPLGKLWSQTRLTSELWKNPPDIYFAPGQLVPFFYTPKNTVTFLHDSAFRVFPSAYNFWGRQYLKLMDRQIIRASKFIVTSSEFNKVEIMRLYGKKANNKVRVVPLGFSTEFNEAKKDQAVLDRYNVKSPYILYVGRVEEKKNIIRLVQAYNEVRSKTICQLVLVGKPRVGHDKIANEITKSQYQKDIKELGFVAKEDLPAFYASATVFAFPSLYEGFGLPVLEAFAAGIPVLTSKGTGAAEVGGNAVLTVDPDSVIEIANGLSKLLGNSGLRYELVQKGRARLKDFSWDKTALGIWEIIRNCQP
ncbi:MAG TPA: glycosyltransferase family 1 protein [Patescibacteria group bacterium]|nr:glycosyltransferase family 1 protein [Patescibacteria group bacterium]